MCRCSLGGCATCFVTSPPASINLPWLMLPFPLRQGAKYLTGLLGRASAAAGDEAASAAIATELQDLAPRGEHVNTATALAAVKTHGATKLSA